MKIPCPQCDGLMKKIVERHKYTESGLDSVIIENLEMHECQCGVTIPSFFQLKRLNDAIAAKLVRKPAMLEGNEITFLRKNIPMVAKDFCQLIGVGKTTLSKWENGRQKHSEANDRSVRLHYMNLMGFEPDEIINILNSNKFYKLGEQSQGFLISVELIEEEWITAIVPMVGAQSDNTHIDLCQEACDRAAAHPSWASHGISNDKTDGTLSYMDLDTATVINSLPNWRR